MSVNSAACLEAVVGFGVLGVGEGRNPRVVVDAMLQSPPPRLPLLLPIVFLVWP
jgi:hypothetical protein